MAEQTIIVMSDSHGERDIVVDIKNRYQGKVDAIFHNGDSELESSDPVWEGIHVVRGNCDYDSGYPERLVVKLGDVIGQTPARPGSGKIYFEVRKKNTVQNTVKLIDEKSMSIKIKG